MRAVIVALGVSLAHGSALAACANMPSGTIPMSPIEILAPGREGAIATNVRNLVAADPTQVQGMLKAVAAGTPSQKAAVGAGIGQAAVVCGRSDSDSARKLQEGVLAAKDDAITTAFQTVTGDRRTAAVGGGGGAGGGGGGSLGGGGLTFPNNQGGSQSSSYAPTGTLSYLNPGPSGQASSGTTLGLASRGISSSPLFSVSRSSQ